MISSLVAISVVSIRFNDGSDGQLNLDNDVVDDDILSVNDKVTILAGKYAGCSGVLEKVSGRKKKVKVRRNCGDGRRGDGKSWWYKPGQVEEIIEDEATGAKEEDAPQEQGISLVVNAEFHRKHLLCDRYKDLPAINPRAKPPVLGGRPVVRRGQEVLFKAHGDVVSSMTSADVEVLGAKTPIGSISARIQGEEIYLNLPALAPVGEYELRLYKAKKIVATFPFIVVFNPFTCSDCPEHSDEHEEYVAGDEGLLWQGLSDDHTANIWHHEPFRAANLLISLALLQHLPLELRGDVVAVSRFLTNAVGEKVCYGKWGDGNYATGKPAKGYRCKSKKSIKRHADKWSHTCHDPSTWHGSSPLLEQHWGLVQSGAPGTAVQYCQCFVFSGVLTTIGRSLGLATRSVTNFQSAHDVNSDRGVSKFFFSTPEGIWDPVDFPDELCPDWCEKSKKCEGCETALRRGRGFSGKCKACIPCVPCHSRDDSIWSFHVWNEMYFSRGKETTNGWQTLDATPQELSNGKFQMGPASVKEVQNGTSDCYDTDFVIGEVNGDIKLYVYNVPDLNEKTKIRAMDKGDFVLHNGDPLFLGFRWYTDPFGETYNNVGFKIVTKKPGPIARKCVKNPAKCQMEELDLTPTYKQCPDAQDRQMPFCAAGYQINKATCADPGKTMLSLLEQKEANLLEDTAFRQAGKIHELTGSHVKDVEATFDDFVPKYVEINHDLPLQITFKNRGGEKRKVNIAISAMGMDYRGLPVIHMETRRKKYAMKLPIEGEQTLLQRSVVLEPYESQTFQYVVPAENLDEDLLESLEVNAAQGNFFLQFHVSAHVEETGQTFARQPRRRLTESD